MTSKNLDHDKPSSRKPAVTLFVAAFAAFLATFNETFLNVGFAPIMESLSVDVSTVQWLATAYMLGAAVMVPVSAFAYRSFPTRPLFCATTALLVIGSVVGALAQNFAVLLIGRIIQALGTGMLIPIGMNITLEVAPREKLGTYMGIMGAMTTLGPSSSVILAGLILAVADWHMLLWTFAALSTLCFLAGAIILRDIAKLSYPRLDALSVALIGIALIGILYGISMVFGGNVIIALVAAIIGIIALVAFIKRQGKLADPLINLEPLKIAPFAVGVIANMLSLIVIFAMNIIVPTFMQSILGTPALVASLTLFPAILCSCVVSPVAGRVFDKHGPGVLLPLGFACMAAFSVLTGIFIATANPIVLALIYIPVICGSALVIGPVQSFALSKLSYQLNPHGVTVMSTGFQIAGCIGSSVFTGVYAAVSAVTAAGGASAAQAATQGMVVTGCLVGAVALVGFIVALWIRRQAASSAIAATESWEQAQVEEAVHESGMGIEPNVVSLMKTDVYTLAEDALASDAMQLFASKGISGAPVVSERGAIVGFVSDGDVMRSLANQVPAFKSAWSFIVELDNEDFNKTLGEVMKTPVSQMATRNVITVNATDDMGAVARVLVDNHLKKAPVMQDGHMVGIINRSNITAYAVSAYLGEATN
ncbi:MAG TPA: MFS transporter [Coriobacteriaceae bacterium]|nr:MFS transporter [Coriobacteriaceae bacterium]